MATVPEHHPTDLYLPPDLFEANEEWGANCGPAAIAAALSLPLSAVRPALRAFRGHMNPSEVIAALKALGAPAIRLKSCPPEDLRRGCAHIMFDGSWSAAGPRVQYAYSHWVAYRRDPSGLLIYDMNDGDAGRWSSLPVWERDVLPLLMPKKGTGYHVNVYLEVGY